jgi:hypothetical protein
MKKLSGDDKVNQIIMSHVKASEEVLFGSGGMYVEDDKAMKEMRDRVKSIN